MANITIRGAREHNLDNVDLTLPGERLICFTGVSGSGKSSMAFDTLYAEGQRRYFESLSSYARQFLVKLPKPDADHISGLRPAISISQKTGVQNSRSTVGTITETSDYLRVLFARVGRGYCPKCGRPIAALTSSQIRERLNRIPNGSRITALAPIARNQKGRCVEAFTAIRKKGIRRARVDGRIVSLDGEINLDRQARHSIDAVVDRFEIDESTARRIADAVDATLQLGKGRMIALVEGENARASRDDASSTDEASCIDEFAFSTSEDRANNGDAPRRPAERGANVEELFFSVDYACSNCGISFDRPTPQMFSFNSAQGRCLSCQGMGSIFTFDPKLLIPDESKSFQQGCFVPIGKWQTLSNWRQHVYQGAAEAIEKRYSLERGAVLETAWEELDERAKHDLLWGADDPSVSYTLTSGTTEHKWKGVFEGIIPRMLAQYGETTNKMQLAAMERYMRSIPCERCNGERLNAQARAVKLETASSAPLFAAKKEYSLPELSELAIPDLMEFFSALSLNETERVVAKELVQEIRKRLGFLIDVGLNYLSLGRPAPTLSGGEMQRIRLAGQIGGGLVGALYVLDEPSIGLHPTDNDRLISALKKLRDLGNSVVVVEHDEDTMLAADYLVDFGPGPGARGGSVVAAGTVGDILTAQRDGSLTAKFIAGDESIPAPAERKRPDGRWLTVKGARRHNLKNINARIPLGGVVCVTGVSGSGKSSLVNDILRETLATELNGADPRERDFDSIEGTEHLKKLISIDQSPIGRTPRSNPATYVKLFDEIRRLFSETPDARAKGFTPGRFSFNLRGGRCETCEGNGSVRMEMDFLADVWTTCPACEGRRFNKETLSVKYKGLSIDQVLDLEIEQALKHFENVPRIREKLQTLVDVGLGYMKLGQPSPTLSGGEAQRVKLAKELAKKSFGKTIYLLDEPTTGLHFADIRALLKVLRSFADAGNTVLIVEHNLEVVKAADWVIDLGPGGGSEGGRIVAEGAPEEIAKNPNSRTGRALKEFLSRDRKATVKKIVAAESKIDKDALFSEQNEEPIEIYGAREHNLQNVSVTLPRNKTTVFCGPSGSGKSSLAVDVLYAEGRRRYVESLSSYARQFLGQLQKPDVEKIVGVSPSIAIEQKTTNSSPRSTVGTMTEILDYLRVVFARLGVPYCPDCDVPIGAQSTDQIVARVMALGADSDRRVMVAAPVEPEQDETTTNFWERLRAQGFARARVDGETYSLDAPPELDRKRAFVVEAVVDRLQFKKDADSQWVKKFRGRVASSVETALEWGKGTLRIVLVDDPRPEKDWKVVVMSRKRSCEKCGRAFEALEPRNFSFNHQMGMCPHCQGLGVQIGSRSRSFIRDSKLTLAEGAAAMWSKFDSPFETATLRALARTFQMPLDVPFERLDARFRRLILSGAGDRWIDVLESDLKYASVASTAEARARDAEKYVAPDDGDNAVAFQFQYKGLYPAAEEAGRLAPRYRGRLEYQTEECECSACLGSRLRDDAAAVRFHSQTLDQICRAPLDETLHFFETLELSALERDVAGDLIDEIVARLRFLIDVGLGYLTLARPAPSLSGGESQRIRLAAQIGSGLVGALYVLDEPTIGLHPRDNKRLIAAMRKLRDLGNTLVVVEHDQEIIESADNIVDFGPGAGARGGCVVAQGSLDEVLNNKQSVTGPFLSGADSIPIPTNRRIAP